MMPRLLQRRLVRFEWYLLLKDQEALLRACNCCGSHLGIYEPVGAGRHDNAVLAKPVDIDICRTGVFPDDSHVRNTDAGFYKLPESDPRRLIIAHRTEQRWIGASPSGREDLVCALSATKRDLPRA